MPTLYQKASDAIYEQAQGVINKHHDRLLKADVKIDFLMAFASQDDNGYPTGPAITHQGYRAAGLCRILSLKDRAMGRGDAEIILDGDRWESWDVERQNALLDHELTHLSLVVNQMDVLQRDDLDRPKLRLRKHDFQTGDFIEVAKRHGMHSFECEHAKRVMDEAGQFFWPYLFENPTGPKRAMLQATERRAA
jgi:hypothetical protein